MKRIPSRAESKQNNKTKQNKNAFVYIILISHNRFLKQNKKTKPIQAKQKKILYCLIKSKTKTFVHSILIDQKQKTPLFTSFWFLITDIP